GRYFLVRDVTEKMDVLGTVGSCGAPNFRQVQGGLTVFGMGQPSLSGFRRVLQKLQKDGHRECVIFCVREEPVLFLRADEDFVSYTPRDKQNLHENLHGLGPGVRAESLELAIRKEVRTSAIHDFAQLSENTYHVYHNTEDPRGEPHAVAICGEDDVHVTEEVYKRPLFLQPTYRYHGATPALAPRGGHGCSRSCSPVVASVSLSAGWVESPTPMSPTVGAVSEQCPGMGMRGIPRMGACLMGYSPSPGRYHRLPLPEQGGPLEAQLDAFVSVLR
ncbi:Paladin, partial [Saguinus oedipus]